MRRGTTIGALLPLALVAAALAGASDAGAVVVRTPSGHFLGITPKPGVTPSSLSGARVPRAATRTSGNGNLDYNGGPVLHSSAPYLIFWDPSGSGISSASRGLLTQYLADVAGDSGNASNVYAVNRQFPDRSGIADYKQVFGAGQVIGDTQPYPSRDLINCPDVGATYLNCVTDAQIENELSHLISTDHLPTGTGPNAPVYLVVTPGDTNVCFDATDCLDSVTNGFCAYHGDFTDGSAEVLYASIPMFYNGASPEQNPKGCQADGNTAVQEPNGNIADVAIKYLSHELSEAITDPTFEGWWDQNSGNEDGDNCNFFGSFDPTNGSNPNAFTPTLGGDAGAGTLYNQSINGHHYYTQSEWSNGNVNCEMQPTAGAIVPQFSASNTRPGSAAVLDPRSSSSSQGFSSESWDFGDGAAAFSTGGPAAVTHVFAAVGTYPVKLTIVDAVGNVSSVTRQVFIGPVATARFVFSPSRPETGLPVTFNGLSSTDPGGSITRMTWDFGDGSAAAVGGTAKHTYTRRGTYRVVLTVQDGDGQASSQAQMITVRAPHISAKLRARRLRITVDQPGVVKLKGKRKRLGHAGTASFKVALTNSQKRQLRAGHAVKLRLKLVFAPLLGETTTKTVTVKVRS